MFDTDQFIQRLRAQMAAPLPGRAAQFQMAFARRVEEYLKNPSPPPDAKIGCVLLLLWPSENNWHTALIRRTDNPRDRHRGQISFPGGRHEASDSSLAGTALREAEEELGIAADSVEILGALTDLYIPVSNFSVHPFVGVLHEPPMFAMQPGEVEEVYTPTIAHFQQPGARQTTDLVVTQDFSLQNVPCFMVSGRAVWGATAMILSEFLALLD